MTEEITKLKKVRKPRVKKEQPEPILHKREVFPVEINDKFKSKQDHAYTDNVFGWKFGKVQGTVVKVMATRIFIECKFVPGRQYEISKSDFKKLNQYRKL